MRVGGLVVAVVVPTSAYKIKPSFGGSFARRLHMQESFNTPAICAFSPSLARIGLSSPSMRKSESLLCAVALEYVGKSNTYYPNMSPR